MSLFVTRIVGFFTHYCYLERNMVNHDLQSSYKNLNLILSFKITKRKLDGCSGVVLQNQKKGLCLFWEKQYWGMIDSKRYC